jgi:hypothetical protein
MAGWEWLIFSVIAFLVVPGLITRRGSLIKEFERNEQYDAPSVKQIRWDIRNAREDMHMLVLTNYAIFVILLAMLLFKN